MTRRRGGPCARPLSGVEEPRWNVLDVTHSPPSRCREQAGTSPALAWRRKRVAVRIGRLPVHGDEAIPDETLTDEAVARAARHAPAAFAALYRRHVDPVYRYCYRRLGTREAAEDATSRTFERALAGLAGFRRGSFRAWLFTIARHVTVDAMRDAGRSISLSPTFDQADTAPGPEEIATAREDAAWVHQLLAQLTGDPREVVELRLAGLDDGEIARVLGKRPGAVRTAQYRALKRLRELAVMDERRNP